MGEGYGGGRQPSPSCFQAATLQLTRTDRIHQWVPGTFAEAVV
jgi:hypothetical protein